MYIYVSNNLGDSFEFPREQSRRLGEKSTSSNIETMPEMDEIVSVILKAKNDAMSQCQALGIMVNNEEWINIGISKPATDEEEHSEEEWSDGTFDQNYNEELMDKTGIQLIYLGN